MTNDTAIMDAALEYLEQDFSVIPVDRITKKPLIPWKEFQSRFPTEDEIYEWWEKWPDANVAIVTGKQSNLVVIDSDGVIGGKWVTDNIAKTTVYVETSENRFHSYFGYDYTLEIGNSVNLAPEVDIRGEGGYVVAAPSIHASGHVYTLKIVGGGWNDLPMYEPVNGEKNAIIQATTKGNLNLNLTNVKAAPINVGVNKGSRNNTLAALAGKWFNSGLDSAEARVLADHWNSSNQPPLGEKELKNTLNSIHKIHKKNNPKTTIQETPDLIPSMPEADNPDIPDFLLHPGGTLEKMMNYITDNSAVSVPFFSLGASLSMLGNVLGQKVMTQSGLRTNLYCIALGYSGSGKNGPMATLPQLLKKTTASQIVGPSEVTSDAAILGWLSNDSGNGRNCWMCMDEIGQMLAGMKNPNSPQAGIPRLLTKLFSSANTSETKAYADASKNMLIVWHLLGFFGATTPERMWEAVGSAGILDGFLPRILFFESLHEAPFPRWNINFEIPADLIQEISDLYEIPIEYSQTAGNLAQATQLYDSPIPNVIPLTPAAGEIYQAFMQEYHKLKNDYRKDPTGIAAVYGRTAEHAWKVALIHAASRQGASVSCIDTESIKYACQLIEFLTGRMITQIQENITDTEIGKKKQQIIKSIRAVSAKNRKLKINQIGASVRDLQRGGCKGLMAREMKELLCDLVTAEKVGKKSQLSKKNTVQDFFYVV